MTEEQQHDVQFVRFAGRVMITIGCVVGAVAMTLGAIRLITVFFPLP